MSQSQDDAPDRLQIRIRLNNKPRLTLVARYLKENNYDLTQEVIKLLEARFLPEAIQQYEGKVRNNIVFESVGALEGYARAIERSCGIAPTPLALVPPTHSNGHLASAPEEPEEAPPPDPLQSQQDLSKKMFGSGAFQ